MHTIHQVQFSDVINLVREYETLEGNPVSFLVLIMSGEPFAEIIRDLAESLVDFPTFERMCEDRRIHFVQIFDGLSDSLIESVQIPHSLSPNTECLVVQDGSKIYCQPQKDNS